MTRDIDLTVIPAVYGVAKWLPAFIASLESQEGVDLSRIEVVAVDDGSPDEGLALLQEWAATSALQVVVLTKPNGGQGSARNLGLTVARGEWVTFTDPDDTLDRLYLQQVLACVREHPEVQLVATARWMLDEATGMLRNSHPLRKMFVEDVVLDLDEHPTFFHGSAPSAVFRLDRLREHGIEFHPEIRPNFEDGHFCASYLLTCDAPVVAFLGSAVYRYLKRADGSSTLNSSVAQPTRYTVVPRLGYLDVLERGARRNGRPPLWLQEFVLYELSWYFGSETAQGGSRTAAFGETGRVFLQLLGEIAAHLDPEVVLAYRGRRFDGVWRDVLLHGASQDPWHAPYAVLTGTDRVQGVRRVMTRFHLSEPETTYVVDGTPVPAVHTKLRSHVYFGHPVMTDRISWVPLGELEVRLDGAAVEVLDRWPTPPKPEPLKPPVPPRLTVRVKRKRVSLQRKVVRKLSRSAALGGEFAGAWVLLDRVHDARDSAEIVFEHLRVHRPEVNAFFVVEAGTPDFERLSGRWGSRVVAYGSRRWLRLMLNCTDVISSHADVPVVRPPAVVRALWPGKPRWRVSFLQHGVIKDDLSAWLNPKRLDLFVVSTPGELASVVGDGSSYAYTSKEVVLTGLPRFDRLLEQARAVPPEQRDLLLVAPTWRHSLLPPLAAGSQRRSVHADFLESEYARQWWGLLTSERLRVAAVAAGVRVAFLPHPNMSSVLELLELPEHVVALSFDDGDVQELFARAAVLVTDYSSMAFNVALLDRPVVYFPFDLAAVQAGAHVGRVGYFDYGRDGFGPVACELGALLSELEGVLARGCVSEPVYAERAAQAFGGVRDGRCTERVVQALLDLRAPHDAAQPVGTPR